jgi:hypothetical protein
MAFRNFEIRVEVQCCTVHPTLVTGRLEKLASAIWMFSFFNVKSASTMSEKPMPHLEIASTCICTPPYTVIFVLVCNFSR